MSTECYLCGNPVSYNCMGLNRKMINRGIDKFLCMSCLAKHFHVSIDDLNVQIEHFRAAGCTLFTPEEESPNSQKPNGK